MPLARVRYTQFGTKLSSFSLLVSNPGAIIETVDHIQCDGTRSVNVEKTNILENETIRVIEHREEIEKLDQLKESGFNEVMDGTIEVVSAEDLQTSFAVSTADKYEPWKSTTEEKTERASNLEGEQLVEVKKEDLSVKTAEDKEGKIPSFEVTLEDKEVKVGSILKLRVKLVENVKTVVSWKRDGEVIADDVRYNFEEDNEIHTLELVDAEADAGGCYTCEAENNVGIVDTSCIVSEWRIIFWCIFIRNFNKYNFILLYI